MSAKRILLVEDDAKSRYAVQSVLEDLGHQVFAYSDAEKAMVGKAQFDAAIIDVRLPLQQGPEFGMALREKNPNCRIIFVTAYDSIPHVRQAVPGCVVLVKPIDMDVLAKLCDGTSGTK